MTNDSTESNTVDDVLETLKAQVASLTASLNAKEDFERTGVITEIATLAKELEMDIDVKEFEGMPKDSLFMFRNQYKKLLDMQVKAKRSESRFVERTQTDKFDGQSNGLVFDKIVDIVSTMWNLPILDKEGKKEVMFQHRSEGIEYEVE